MSTSSGRLSSLDQFRGYTVLGMFFVNFVGGFHHIPEVFSHHHTYCSYADTIMPQFLLAVGFGMRLSFLRRGEREGRAAAYRHIAGRCLGLILLSVVVYHLTGRYEKFEHLTAQPPGPFLINTFKRGPFEALMHIAVTGLWVLPVIAAPGWVRGLFAVGSGGLHVWLSYAGYYTWNMTPPVGIDGGPLGFLTWAIPLVAGTLAYDWVTAAGRPMLRILMAGAVLMAVAYGLSLRSPQATLPFVPPAGPFPDHYWQSNPEYYWTMSQRAGSVTYTTFAAGFGLWVYAVFLIVCDWWGYRWDYLDLLGRHALAGYVIHGMVDGAVGPFVPKDSPAWWALAGFLMYLGIITVFLRYLDRNRYYLKL